MSPCRERVCVFKRLHLVTKGGCMRDWTSRVDGMHLSGIKVGSLLAMPRTAGERRRMDDERGLGQIPS